MLRGAIGRYYHIWQLEWDERFIEIRVDGESLLKVRRRFAGRWSWSFCLVSKGPCLRPSGVVGRGFGMLEEFSGHFPLSSAVVCSPQPPAATSSTSASLLGTCPPHAQAQVDLSVADPQRTSWPNPFTRNKSLRRNPFGVGGPKVTRQVEGHG